MCPLLSPDTSFAAVYDEATQAESLSAWFSSQGVKKSHIPPLLTCITQAAKAFYHKITQEKQEQQQQQQEAIDNRPAVVARASSSGGGRRGARGPQPGSRRHTAVGKRLVSLLVFPWWL